MKKGRKQPTWIWLAVIGLVLVGTGTIDLSALSAVDGVDQVVVGSCASEGVRPVISATAYDVDPTQNNKQTQVATTVLFAKADSSMIYNSTTGSATASTDVSVPCGDRVSVLVGDGGGTTYYYNGETFDATGVSHSFNIEVKRSGAATMAFHNETHTGWASTITYANTSVSDGDTDLEFRLSPPQGAGEMFGDKGYAMCVKWNSLNFTKVYPMTGSAVTIAHISGTSTLDKVACYEMPGVLASGSSPYEGRFYLDTTGTNPMQNETTIDVVLVDKTSGLFNGLIYSGYDTSAPGGDAQATDLGRTDVTQAAAITIGGVPA